MVEKTLIERRQEREAEAAEPINRAERLASGAKDYINAHHVFDANVEGAVGTAVEVKNKGRKIIAIALPNGKWTFDGQELGQEFDHEAILDRVLDFLGWPKVAPLDKAA
jgi:hypothetical protein